MSVVENTFTIHPFAQVLVLGKSELLNLCLSDEFSYEPITSVLVKYVSVTNLNRIDTHEHIRVNTDPVPKTLQLIGVPSKLIITDTLPP